MTNRSPQIYTCKHEGCIFLKRKLMHKLTPNSNLKRDSIDRKHRALGRPNSKFLDLFDMYYRIMIPVNYRTQITNLEIILQHHQHKLSLQAIDLCSFKKKRWDPYFDYSIKLNVYYQKYSFCKRTESTKNNRNKHTGFYKSTSSIFIKQVFKEKLKTNPYNTQISKIKLTEKFQPKQWDEQIYDQILLLCHPK